MSLEKRKANITFLSSDSVIITTSLWQKTFILKENTAVDLFKLKKISIKDEDTWSGAGNDCPFYAYFKSTNKKEYTGTIVIRPGKDKIQVLSQEVSIGSNNITYSVSVFVEE